MMDQPRHRIFHRLRFRAGPPAACLLAVLAPSPGQAQIDEAAVAVTIIGVKSEKGVIRLALCPPAAPFPNCRDRAVRTASLTIANGTARTELTGLAAGSYAVSVFHDANANGKLDTMLGVPREGYGFSRNPPFKPRAPRFSEAQIELRDRVSITIKLRYVL